MDLTSRAVLALFLRLYLRLQFAHQRTRGMNEDLEEVDIRGLSSYFLPTPSFPEGLVLLSKAVTFVSVNFTLQ